MEVVMNSTETIIKETYDLLSRMSYILDDLDSKLGIDSNEELWD